MVSDLRYALRQLAKHPSFTLVSVLILAIGIGVNTAIFTAIDVALLRPLPVRDPQNLILATTVRTQDSASEGADKLPYSVYELFRDRAQSLHGLAAMSRLRRTLSIKAEGRADTADVQSSEVSGNFFSLLGVGPTIGRVLVPADDDKSSPRPVAVLSHGFWLRKFGGDPAVLGRTVQLDHTTVTIVGVAAEKFFGVEVGQAVDLWVPLQLDQALEPDGGRVRIGEFAGKFCLLIGRLQPGVSSKSASAELDLLYQGYVAARGIPAADRAKAWGKLQLEPGGAGRFDHRSDLVRLAGSLVVVLGFVLAIVCANVASLTLARVMHRQRELAVRSALGAGRGRLIRQLLMESLVITVTGGGLGLVIAEWTTSLLTRESQGAFDTGLDARMLFYIASVSIVTGLLVGIVPALRGTSLNLVDALKAQSNGIVPGSKQQLSKALVASQIALSVCMLAVAGLFVRSLQALKKVDLGFNRENLLQVVVSFDALYSPDQKLLLARDLVTSFDGLPGVGAVSVAARGLWGGGGSDRAEFTVAGNVSAGKNYASVSYIGANFFGTTGINLLRGRGFVADEVFPGSGRLLPTAAVAVINEAVARQFFGDTDPLGRSLNLYVGGAHTWTIVGVARNTPYGNLTDANTLQIYLPFRPLPTTRDIGLVIRTLGTSAALRASLPDVLKRIDGSANLIFVASMDERLDGFLIQERVIAQAAGYFGGFALVLSCMGLYGLLSYFVAQRTREIGVRIALGARLPDVMTLVTGQGLRLAAVGCVLGLMLAVALIHFGASRMYGIVAADPAALGGAVVLLFGTTAIACWLPARRAARIDPMVALRAE